MKSGCPRYSHRCVWGGGGVAVLTVQECQSYSQFHNCNFMSRIWLRAFSRFLILPKDLHLVVVVVVVGVGGGSQTELPYSRTGQTNPSYAASFTSLRKEYKFHLRNPRVLLALVQTLLTCVFHLKSFAIIVIQRCLMLSTFFEDSSL